MSTYICRDYVSGHFEIAENDTGARIATVDKCYGDVARVMAAAPALLAALEAMVDMEDWSQEDIDPQSTVGKAYAAIAAAKGEA